MINLYSLFGDYTSLNSNFTLSIEFFINTELQPSFDL